MGNGETFQQYVTGAGYVKHAGQFGRIRISGYEYSSSDIMYRFHQIRFYPTGIRMNDVSDEIEFTGFSINFKPVNPGDEIPRLKIINKDTPPEQVWL